MEQSEKVGKNTGSPRKYKRGSGRERVLDAYASILRQEGESAATLDEVALRAEISKGGLLHHFGSKDALIGGLLERLTLENQADIDRTMASDHDPVEAYLTSCMQADDSYSETYLAVMKLAGSSDGRVDQTLAEVLQGWQDALTERMDDPVMARLIQLLGDGLYSHALMNIPDQPIDRGVLRLAQELLSGR
ncbi:TetR/AcrR family transcriptional regulator [Jonesiaceae bacterium BS-20]|uniref:TetR/AcrR family transcriptional regulator n=1 Tax=Jonesiaceae bacterium BS-20 TaxID=3120821 RepID=A0AAU7DUT5_9MICO